jgi:hypothetical protein
MPKVMVVIPEGLLSEVDGAAAASQTNRSAFICRSLRAQLRSDRLRHLRRKILDDAKIIAGDFQKYWNPEDDPMWMAAENEALSLVEEGGPVNESRPARRSIPRSTRSDRRKRTGGSQTGPRGSK